MNNFPRLLTPLNEQFVSEEVFSHLELDNLFSYKTKKILQKACSEQEIHLRQQLFSVLRSEEALHFFESFLQELHTYRKWQLLQESEPENLLYPLYVGRALSRLIKLVESFVGVVAFSGPRRMLKAWADSHGDFINDTQQCLQILEKSADQFFSCERRKRGTMSFVRPIADLCSMLEIFSEGSPTAQLPASFLKAFLEDPVRKKPLSCYQKKYGREFPHGIEQLLEDCEFFSEINRIVRQKEVSWENWCFPKISNDSEFSFSEGFNVFECRPVAVPVANSFCRKSSFTLVRGINSGGKTTFLKLCAVIVLLGRAGCPIPCKDGKISLYTGMATIFADSEGWDDGRFETEKRVLTETLKDLNRGGILFINELYSSTKDYRAISEIQDLAQKISERDIDCVFVTHFDVPHCSTLFAETDTDGLPTYRMTDDSSAIISYTRRILEKYGLHREQLQGSEE